MIYLVCSRENHFTTIKEQQGMAQSLLRAELLRERSVDIEQCGIVKNAWGKPFLKDHPDTYFNISHCSGGVALSISSCKTGIDVENIRAFSMTTARKVLSEEELRIVVNSEQPERAFFKFWTLKECYTKALGTGLSYPLRKINFTIDRNSNIQSNMKGCMFGLLESDLNYVAAVCYLSKDDHLKETVVCYLLP